MAKTTFSGPVRSENGYKLVSKTASTGVVHDRTVHDLGIKDTRRYYLEEYFAQLPGVNADLASSTEATNTPVSRNFEVIGTNKTSALATFNATSAGMTITTAGADQDQMIVAPHLDTKQSAWTQTGWGTENQVHWEASVRTASSIADVKLWAGLKLTNDQLPETDANQAYFYFATDATNGQALSSYTPLYFIYSIAGADYLTNTGITVAADTNYHFKISIDSDRKASIFVNGVQYGLATTATTTFDGTTSVTGTTQATIDDITQKSTALTNDINLIPYVGVETGTGSAKAFNLHYEAISRLIYE
jgi:hypothetical protein